MTRNVPVKERIPDDSRVWLENIEQFHTATNQQSAFYYYGWVLPKDIRNLKELIRFSKLILKIEYTDGQKITRC